VDVVVGIPKAVGDEAVDELEIAKGGEVAGAGEEVGDA